MDGEKVMQQQWLARQRDELVTALKAQTVDINIATIDVSDYQADIGELVSYIDHTLLKPHADLKQIREFIQQAREYNFASVCIHPRYVKLAAKLLAARSTVVCTVIGFPLGANTTESKVAEAKDAAKNGATELDMVVPIGELKSGNYLAVYQDIAAVKSAVNQCLVKVILETSFLTDAEIVKACLLTKAAGADFVKTSTGFAAGGATLEVVSLMRQVVGPQFGVKAAGGIRNKTQALAMLKAGANRIGTSSGIAIAKLSAGEKHAKQT